MVSIENVIHNKQKGHIKYTLMIKKLSIWRYIGDKL